MNVALILAGGTGTRLGSDIPKQYMSVNGRTIIAHCLQVFGDHPQIDAIQIVAHQEWHEEICEQMTDAVADKFRGFSVPGKNRQCSILNGLQDIMQYAGEKDVVMIHDAARPLLTAQQITDCLEAVAGHDGVLPVLPMKDTVYYSEDGIRVSSLLERARIFAGQAPEVFVLGKYYEANRKLLPERILKINGSTEPAVMAGMDIAMIPGDEGNFKITTKADLERFQEKIEDMSD